MKIMCIALLAGMGSAFFALHAQEGTDQAVQPTREIIELDAAIFDDYVGVYFWPPHKTLITVTKEDGKLFGQPEGKVKSQLLPWDVDQFVIDEVGAELSFVRDDDGQVTGMILSQDSEQNLAERVSGEKLAQIKKEKEHQRKHHRH